MSQFGKGHSSSSTSTSSSKSRGSTKSGDPSSAMNSGTGIGRHNSTANNNNNDLVLADDSTCARGLRESFSGRGQQQSSASFVKTSLHHHQPQPQQQQPRNSIDAQLIGNTRQQPQAASGLKQQQTSAHHSTTSNTQRLGSIEILNENKQRQLQLEQQESFKQHLEQRHRLIQLQQKQAQQSLDLTPAYQVETSAPYYAARVAPTPSCGLPLGGSPEMAPKQRLLNNAVESCNQQQSRSSKLTVNPFADANDDELTNWSSTKGSAMFVGTASAAAKETSDDKSASTVSGKSGFLAALIDNEDEESAPGLGQARDEGHQHQPATATTSTEKTAATRYSKVAQGGSSSYNYDEDPSRKPFYMRDLTTLLNDCRGSRKLVILIVAIALLLDNMLLTAVVPIIPSYLYKLRWERENRQLLEGKLGNLSEQSGGDKFLMSLDTNKNGLLEREELDAELARRINQVGASARDRYVGVFHPKLLKQKQRESNNNADDDDDDDDNGGGDNNNDNDDQDDDEESESWRPKSGKKDDDDGGGGGGQADERAASRRATGRRRPRRASALNDDDYQRLDDEAEETSGGDRRKERPAGRSRSNNMMVKLAQVKKPKVPSTSSTTTGATVEPAPRDGNDDDDADNSFGRHNGNMNTEKEQRGETNGGNTDNEDANDDDDSGIATDDDDEDAANSRRWQKLRSSLASVAKKNGNDSETLGGMCLRMALDDGNWRPGGTLSSSSRNQIDERQDGGEEKQKTSRRPDRLGSKGDKSRPAKGAAAMVERKKPAKKLRTVVKSTSTSTTTTTTMRTPTNEELNRNEEELVIDHQAIVDESFEVGVMFASKPIVQAIANPFVGAITNRVGFTLPMFLGFTIMFLSTLVFAFGSSYATLFLARAIQGVGSACTSVAGMSMIADRFPDDAERGNAMAIALGGLALGVVIGPPFGGFMYEFFGKPSPFIVLAALALMDGLLQLLVLQPRITKSHDEGASLMTLIKDPYILVAAGAITFANTGIGILEPALPLWMMDTMQAKNWEQGVAFLPAALSYLFSTNLFGNLGLRIGRWRSAMLGLVIIGCSLLLIPFAKRVDHLILPNGAIGFAIGMVDSTMMPMLGYLVDIRHTSVYGSVYAIGDVAFCASFVFGPALSGTLVELVGFEGLIIATALICFSFAPLLLLLRDPPARQPNADVAAQLQEQSTMRYVNYNHLDSPDEEASQLTSASKTSYVR